MAFLNSFQYKNAIVSLREKGLSRPESSHPILKSAKTMTIYMWNLGTKSEVEIERIKLADVGVWSFM